MTGTITTTVTFADLISAYDDELDELRDAYDDTVALMKDEFGEGAPERTLPADPADEDAQRLAALQATAYAYDETGKSLQQRQHVLKLLRDEYDDGEFEIKMLTGAELTDIETKLRMDANAKGVDVSVLQAERKRLTADAATVDAPEDVPRDDDGPTPSECPNALTFALFEQIEALNSAGATDFRAPGFGNESVGQPSVTSEAPTTSAPSSSGLETSNSTESAPDSGNDS